jgi:Xaa-Pro dipeptidase
MMDIAAMQEALRREALDGWLFFDHHGRDPLAYRLLSLPTSGMATRRWYYFVPADGEPRKMVHRIESHMLDSLPGDKVTYSSWSDQQQKLTALIAPGGRVAMQYSAMCAIPYVAMVDAGTIELVQSTGALVVSSADLVQEFEAAWSNAQLEQHREAGRHVDKARREAFALIRDRVSSHRSVTEFDVQQFLLHRFSELGMETDHGPIVAVNQNASDPHYEPSHERRVEIRSGDVVLIDLWAKLSEPEAVFYDVTWTGYCGETVPDHVQKVFQVVSEARRHASDFVRTSIETGRRLSGFEVDDACRGFVADRGFGDYFFHRTGHSIGTEVHGTGANMDNLESHDSRRVIPNTCFSIEPGIYLAEFGIRSEVNVFVTKTTAFVTGEEQAELVRI